MGFLSAFSVLVDPFNAKIVMNSNSHLSECSLALGFHAYELSCGNPDDPTLEPMWNSIALWHPHLLRYDIY